MGASLLTLTMTLKIKYVSPSSLKPYSKNARVHSEEQIAQIQDSIKEFGFTNPILVDESLSVIAGHGRLEAAVQLGLEQVPTIELRNLTPEQMQAYVIADNKLALNASWNEDLLKSELLSIQSAGFDLALTGFSTDEIDELLLQTAQLSEKSVELTPIKYTRILISIPVSNAAALVVAEELIAQLNKLGVEIDYGSGV